MPQLRVCMLQIKILHAATKKQQSQINKEFEKLKGTELSIQSWRCSPKKRDRILSEQQVTVIRKKKVGGGSL